MALTGLVPAPADGPRLDVFQVVTLPAPVPAATAARPPTPPEAAAPAAPPHPEPPPPPSPEPAASTVSDAPRPQAAPAPRPVVKPPAARPPAPAAASPSAAPAAQQEAAVPPSSPAQAPVSPPAYVPASHTAAYLNNPPPPYPAWARRRGIEGRVVLTVSVSSDGRPTEARVTQGSGQDRLDDVARAAVLRWRFAPAQRDGRPVPATVVVPIAFSLR